MEKILVLLSTFNGEKYLREQLDSILKQEGVEVHLGIRDDGSTDKTVNILEDYTRSYPENFEFFIKGENVGPSETINIIFSKIDFSKYEYYAFADQDDYWMPTKLIRGIEGLKTLNSSLPRFYLSNLTITDKDLNVKFLSYSKVDVTPTPGCCFVDFHASGNTFVCDRKAIDLIKDSNPLPTVYADVWYFIICVFVGNAYYDNNSYILFRRTGNNASGKREKGAKLFWKHIKGLFHMIFHKEGSMRREMAADLLLKYEKQLDNEKIHVLSTIAEYQDSFAKKCKLIFDPRIKSRSKARNFHMVLRVIFNSF